MPQNELQVIRATTNNQLATALGGLHDTLMRAAQEGLGDDLQGYTSLERQALVKVEALRLLNGFDLATVLERGRFLREIDQEGLVGVFPGDYQTLEQIAAALGISTSEFSDTRSMCDIIFPWLEANSGRTVAEWWDQIGKSKFRELTPVLRALITGEATTGRESVAQAVEALLDQAQTNAVAAGQDLTQEELQQAAIMNALEFGTLPVREMRRQVRPTRTANALGARFQNEDFTYVILRLNEEQRTMYERLFGSHVDNIGLAQDHAAFRQITRLPWE